MIFLSPILLTLFGKFFELVGNEAAAAVKRRQAADVRAERETKRRQQAAKRAFEEARRVAEAEAEEARKQVIRDKIEERDRETQKLKRKIHADEMRREAENNPAQPNPYK